MASATDGISTSLSIAVLTVSDTRTGENDTSGDYLAGAMGEAGHELAARELLPDDYRRLSVPFGFSSD